MLRCKEAMAATALAYTWLGWCSERLTFLVPIMLAAVFLVGIAVTMTLAVAG